MKKIDIEYFPDSPVRLKSVDDVVYEDKQDGPCLSITRLTNQSARSCDV